MTPDSQSEQLLSLLVLCVSLNEIDVYVQRVLHPAKILGTSKDHYFFLGSLTFIINEKSSSLLSTVVVLTAAKVIFIPETSKTEIGIVKCKKYSLFGHIGQYRSIYMTT